ncbi:MAG: hypothetical protein ACREML_06790 [Vulcanimicrobiaceae bacterium]
MSDILVSIIENIADAAATARARRAEAISAMRAPAPVLQSLAQRFTQTAAEQPEYAQPEPAPPPPPEPVAMLLGPITSPTRRLSVHRLFAGPESLIRTVVAAEILGPPLALRRQNLWDSPSV